MCPSNNSISGRKTIYCSMTVAYLNMFTRVGTKIAADNLHYNLFGVYSDTLTFAQQ